MEVAKAAAAAAVAAARSATPPQSVPLPGAVAAANSSSTPPASLDYTPRSSPPSSLNNMSQGGAVGGPVGGMSPRASPPTLVPSAMSMVSMASMLGHPPPFGLPLYGSSPMGPGGTPADFASSMHKFMDRKVTLRKQPFARKGTSCFVRLALGQTYRMLHLLFDTRVSMIFSASDTGLSAAATAPRPLGAPRPQPTTPP